MNAVDRKHRRLYLLAITVNKRTQRTSKRTPGEGVELDYMAQFNTPTGEDETTEARRDREAALYA